VTTTDTAPTGVEDHEPQPQPRTEARTEAETEPRQTGDGPKGWQFNSPLVLTMLLLAGVVLQGPIRGALDAPVMQSWMTVFVAVMVQALPFLVLGVLLSAVIAVFVPPSFFARALPKRPALAVPVAGLAGVVLPGCEFPGRPQMVVARLVASLLVACAMGWLWHRLGRTDWLRPPARPSWEGLGKGAAFWGSVRHDVMHAGGFLVVGAMAAATLKAVVPADWLGLAADNLVVSILALAVLAVLLSICSEADAFVAASLTQFSLTARLTFLVVGPMIDLKLFAMQTGTFGRGFALRFAPATFTLAVLVSSLVGAVLL
jgi:uncharacterized membrane protein YraQ (UPF0718 family)